MRDERVREAIARRLELVAGRKRFGYHFRRVARAPAAARPAAPKTRPVSGGWCETLKKNSHLHLRLPDELMALVQQRAAERGIKYQVWVRETLERAVILKEKTAA
jgi:hypothetical protein